MKHFVTIFLVILSILILGCSGRSHYDKAMRLLEDDESEEAIKHFRKAIDKGYAPAMRQLAALLYEGKKIEPNRVEATQLYRKAAEGGDVESQAVIGALYIKKDVDKGLFWLKKAADAGNSNACVSVVAHYFNKLKNTILDQDLDYKNRSNRYIE